MIFYMIYQFRPVYRRRNEVALVAIILIAWISTTGCTQTEHHSTNQRSKRRWGNEGIFGLLVLLAYQKFQDYLYLTSTTQIVEGTMVYAYKGENLNLTCIINHNYDRRPNHVIWYHQNDIVSYESLRKRDKSPSNSITSHHLIRNVDFDDSGNYTCAPELYGAASTIVQILDGDETQDVIASNKAESLNGFNSRETTFVAFVAGILSLCIFYCHPDKER